jgi:hypothetical protein
VVVLFDFSGSEEHTVFCQIKFLESTPTYRCNSVLKTLIKAEKCGVQMTGASSASIHSSLDDSVRSRRQDVAFASSFFFLFFFCSQLANPAAFL